MKPKYKLKPGQEDFTVMSGPDEGKTFAKGRVYDQVPKGYEDRFFSPDQVKETVPGKKAKPEPADESIPPSQINDGKPGKSKKEK